MDTYSKRSVARYLGVFMIIVFGVVLAMMQKALLSMKQSLGGGAVTHASGFAPGNELEQIARRVMGDEGAEIVAQSDLDHDGKIESLVQCRDHQGQVSRIGVLSPDASRSFRLIFDSARSGDLPPMPRIGGRWNGDFLTLTRMELAAVSGAGEPLGLRVEVSWDPAATRYATRRLGGPAGQAGPAEATPAPAAEAAAAAAAAAAATPAEPALVR